MGANEDGNFGDEECGNEDEYVVDIEEVGAGGKSKVAPGEGRCEGEGMGCPFKLIFESDFRL